MYYFQKTPSKLQIVQHFFVFQLARAAPVLLFELLPSDKLLEAGGKPSTWFPPEELVELTGNARGFPMLSDDFLMRK